MKKINLYIIEKLHLDKDTQVTHNHGFSDDQVTNDFKKIYKIISNIDGKNSELLDYVVAMAEWESDDDDADMYYKFDEHKFYTLFREIVNYDFVSLYGGKLNIKESNHKDLAKILKKYATPDIIKKTMKSFGWI